MIKQHNISPGVSVIMPVYNGARTLLESINSVLTQSYLDLELIICNDASTDGTREILDKIKDDRVYVIHNPVNLGPGLSKDRAIEISRGTWLAFIDADDIWEKDRLKTLLRLTDAGINHIIFDNIIVCHDTPSGMIPWETLRGKHAFGGNGIDAIEVPIDNFILTKSLLIKPLLYANHIKQNNIRHSSLRFAEDTEFFLKLLAIGLSLYYLPKPMYKYRITPGSLSAPPEHHAMMRQVIENSISLFEYRPVVKAALLKKLNIERRKENYLPIIYSLRNKKYFKAFQLVMRSPWIIPDSIPRLLHTIEYHAHRILHNGNHR